MTRDFRVGDWLVEPDLNRISRSGKEISVEPKVLEVLVYLAEQPGEVIPQKTIIRKVWPGTFVSDDVLTYSISELRRAFGDNAKDPHVIQTIPRKGYRLIAPVLRYEAPPLQSRPSVAVMAFSDMSPEKNQEYFCDGIAEDITNILSHVSGLRVVARTSAFAFKGMSEDVRTIGRTLGASTVLEGSVRKAGNRLRITAQLINAEDGCHLWSDRYDREMRDVFAIQDEISWSIVNALKITLSSRESTVLSRVTTTQPQAYEYYLRGKQYFHSYNRKAIEWALRMFSQAAEADPNYARAFAGIADCCAYLYMYAGNNPAHLEQADSASYKAVDLDAESAEGHASRGVALSLKREFELAEYEFEIAAGLNPMLFEAYYFHARTAFTQGRPEQAIKLYEKSIEVNPQDYQAPLLAAQIYSDLGRTAEADAARRRGIRAAGEVLKLNPDDTRALYMGANGLVALGENAEGLEWARQALSADPEDPMILYNVACIQSLAGHIEEAMDCLERSVRNGLSQREWLENDSNLEPLRRHPRYEALIKSLETEVPDSKS